MLHQDQFRNLTIQSMETETPTLPKKTQ